MKNVNDYKGNSDIERIEAAVRDRRGNVVVIPPRISEKEPERSWWLLDRAILLPADTTVIIENCKIKLSDSCRDNFFRSANCGFGINDPEKISNIHIRGVGSAVLEGADHPRSTGDGGKHLECPCPKYITVNGSLQPAWQDPHNHTYGTDAGKEGESQYGDWRNVGILMANVDHLSIENLRIVEPHAWAISLESCSHAKISNIEFKACMTRKIDGIDQNNENQDGINLRAGCHDVIISDITGTTGDDVVAMTAIPSSGQPRPGGALKRTEVMSNDFSRREKDIRNVIIRNVLAYPAGGCLMVRFLALNGAEIRNVTVDGLVDVSPDDFHSYPSVQIGEGVVGKMGYGIQSECAVFNVTISNVISNAKSAIGIANGLQNAVISNVVNRNPEGMVIKMSRPDLLKNVRITNAEEKNGKTF